jgi:hypothetical protein
MGTRIRGFRTAAIAAGFVIGVSAVWFASRPSPTPLAEVESGTPGPVEDPILSKFDTTRPPLLGGATRVSIEEAERMSGRDLFLPSAHSLPTAEVWMPEGFTNVLVRYGDLLVITFDPIKDVPDPATMYAELAEEWQAGDVTVLAGKPAWVVPKDARAPDQPRVPWIRIAVDDWDITIYGQMPLDELIGIAKSLRPATQGI